MPSSLYGHGFHDVNDSQLCRMKISLVGLFRAVKDLKLSNRNPTSWLVCRPDEIIFKTNSKGGLAAACEKIVKN